MITFTCAPPLYYFPTHHPAMSNVLWYVSTPPQHHPSIQPNSVAVGVLSALLPLSVLELHEVGYATMNSMNTPVYSALSIVSDNPSFRRVFIFLRRFCAAALSATHMDRSSDHLHRYWTYEWNCFPCSPPGSNQGSRCGPLAPVHRGVSANVRIRGHNDLCNVSGCRIIYHPLTLGTCGLPCTPGWKTPRNDILPSDVGTCMGFAPPPSSLAVPSHRRPNRCRSLTFSTRNYSIPASPPRRGLLVIH